MQSQPQRKTSTQTATTVPSAKTLVDHRTQYRPHGPRRQNTIRTRYMEMLLDLDKVPRMHNILSSLFGWLLLAGFVVFPGTFTSIKKLSTDPGLANELPTAGEILDRFQNLPLLVIASITCGVGALGLVWLALRWRRNYVWLLNRILLPSTTNALVGLISTLVTVYTQNDGAWSLMAKVTAAVEAADFVVTGMFFVCTTVLLQWVKRQHRKEIGKFEENNEEGLLDKVERKWNEPADAQQSVI